MRSSQHRSSGNRYANSPCYQASTRRPRLGTGFEQLEDRTAPASFSVIPTLSGGLVAIPSGVSGDGTAVVGRSVTANGTNHAFRWTTQGGTQGLGLLPDMTSSYANGISPDGTVIVGIASGSQSGRGFRWSLNGGMVGLDSLTNWAFASPRAVSAGGSVIVGEASTTNPNGQSAALWTASGPQAFIPEGFYYAKGVDVSADGRTVVGNGGTIDDRGPRAFRRTSGGGFDVLDPIPSRDYSTARGVSSNGEFVVGYSHSNGATAEATRWTAGGGAQDLGRLPGAYYSNAAAVSGAGTVVVGESFESRVTLDDGAFIWTQATGMRSLKNVLISEYGLANELAAWSLDFATAISDDGNTIVGYGYNPMGAIQGWIARLDNIDLVASSLDWNTSPGNEGVDFRYEVKNGNLSTPTTAALFWSKSDQLEDVIDADPSTPELDPVFSTPLQSTSGTSIPVHVTRATLGNSPTGTTHLLLVLDPTSENHPRGAIDEASEDNNVKAARGFQVVVDPLYQADARWTTHNPYANSTDLTIAGQGCALTSLSMALNFAGITGWTLTPDGPLILNNPGTLDDLLTAGGGYSGNGVNWEPATRLAAQAKGLPFIYFHTFRTHSTTALEAMLREGYPVIVGVNLNASGGPGHFVLVTGKLEDKFVIVDPGHPSHTTLDAYGNVFETRGFVADPLDISALSVSVSLPEGNVALAVIDPQGRLTGFDSAGARLDQIPQSFHFIDRIDNDTTGAQDLGQTQSVGVFQPAAGDYRILVTGGTTPYQILIHRYLPDGAPLPVLRLDGVGTSEFVVSSGNSAPVLRPITNRTATEGEQYLTLVSADDPDSGQSLRYSLDSAPAGMSIDAVTGLLSWTPEDGPGVARVTVRVSDNGAPSLSDAVSFDIAVTSAAPLATVSGPTSGVRGQLLTFSVGAGDKSAADRAAGFRYLVSWGDGSPDAVIEPTANNGLGLALGHAFIGSGEFNVRVTATDKDGASSAVVTHTVTISQVETQPDPSNPSLTRLVVGGTLGNDLISVIGLGNLGVTVLVNGRLSGLYHPTSRIEVYGQAGNDVIILAGRITAFTRLDGGEGNDLIVGGDEDNTVFGGSGDDILLGGGGNDLLDGGNGNDFIDGGNGNDVIHGGIGFLDVLLGGNGNDTLSDPDGVARAAGDNGADDITIAFAPDWSHNGSSTLPAGAISGGIGDDIIRVHSNRSGLRFDVSGDEGKDRIELSGTWTKARIFGGSGTDTVKNRGIGLLELTSVELAE